MPGNRVVDFRYPPSGKLRLTTDCGGTSTVPWSRKMLLTVSSRGCPISIPTCSSCCAVRCTRFVESGAAATDNGSSLSLEHPGTNSDAFAIARAVHFMLLFMCQILEGDHRLVVLSQ